MVSPEPVYTWAILTGRRSGWLLPYPLLAFATVSTHINITYWRHVVRVAVCGGAEKQKARTLISLDLPRTNLRAPQMALGAGEQRVPF